MTAITLETNRRVGIYRTLGALQVLDIVTTWTLLESLGHGIEGNPLARAIFDSIGTTIGLLMLLVFKLWAVWSLYRKQTGVKIVSAIYGIVIANNVLAIILYLL